MLSTLTPRLRRSPRVTQQQSILPSPISISPKNRQFSPRHHRNTTIYLPHALALISLFSALALFLQGIRIGIQYLRTPHQQTHHSIVQFDNHPSYHSTFQLREHAHEAAHQHLHAHHKLQHTSQRTAVGYKHIDQQHKTHPTVTPHASPHPSAPHSTHHHLNRTIKEETLTSLPNTKWIANPPTVLRIYKPLRSVSTRVRLVTMENACYCTQRNKLLVPRPTNLANRRFPDFLTRFGIAKYTYWKTPSKILAFPAQKVVHIPGTTIMWRGRSLHYYHAHLQRALIPIRSLIDTVRKSGDRSELKLAAEAFPHSDTADERVSQLHQYFLGDIKESNKIELAHYRPRLICFKRVFALGSEFENHAASPDSYEHVKDMISSHTKSKKGLMKSCKEREADKKTIWVMDRQLEHSHSGSMTNQGEVKTAIDHELVRAGLGNEVQVKFIQAPNLVCGPGTRREGCMSTDCSEQRGTGECERRASIMNEAVAFNKMTFLVSTSGPANNGFIYMPRGAVIVEINAHGVFDMSYGDGARDAGLNYFRMENRLSEKLEQALLDRFGDIARSPKTCWQDNECKQLRLKQSLKVDVHHMKIVLRSALREWNHTCHHHH